MMKKFFVTLLVAFSAVAGANASIFDKYTIDRSELPEQAQSMLKEFFPKSSVSMIKVDRHLLKKTDYDVKLTNGTKIEFNNSGKWTAVDCGKREVPAALVPNAVSRYMKRHYADSKIVSIKKSGSGTELRTADELILKFDLLGSFRSAKSVDEHDADDSLAAL